MTLARANVARITSVANLVARGVCEARGSTSLKIRAARGISNDANSFPMMQIRER